MSLILSWQVWTYSMVRSLMFGSFLHGTFHFQRLGCQNHLYFWDVQTTVLACFGHGKVPTELQSQECELRTLKDSRFILINTKWGPQTKSLSW